MAHDGASTGKEDAVSIKSFLLGGPLPTARQKEERLGKAMGLAIFASDNLSSVAYATEEILLVLVLAGTAKLHYSMPIAALIAALIAVVATSYYQTIQAYPSGGGAFVVAKENLGVLPGLVAGASLLIDYVLTVAVSVTAGIAAVTSAIPSLHGHGVLLCVVSIFVLMLANLRGVRETGRLFSIPSYLFIGSLLLLIVVGAWKYLVYPHPPYPEYVNPTVEIMPLFLVLRAFASGCAALTGIEAVANGVQAFKEPEPRNAGITLIWMAGILATFFIGVTFLSEHYGILPSDKETVLSQLARAVFSKGPIYYVIQFATSLILILAANTSFAGFPRLASVMASESYLPRQLSNLGDRLVYSNGIIILGVSAAFLTMVFGGRTHALIPLYAVGVFVSFTLSQAGMVRHWLKGREKGRIKGALINGAGAVATAVVFTVIAITKFSHGAWLVVIAIPALVYMTGAIKRHYSRIAYQLSLDGAPLIPAFGHHTVIVPVSGLQRAVVNALRYARALSSDVAAFYVALDAAQGEELKEKWDAYSLDVPLVIAHSPYRSITRPLMDYIDGVVERYPDGVVTIVLPEFVPTRWWEHLLHNQTALFIKGLLLFRPGVVSISVPLQLGGKDKG